VLALFTGMDVGTLLYLQIGCALSSVMMKNVTTRTRFTFIAFKLSSMCVLLFIVLSDDIMNPSGYVIDAAIVLVTCIASTFLSMGLIALMESVFNTATPLRLTELSSGNTQLLRRLSFEAPGTNHHSLMVGYMAEAAAITIGANPFVTKTGAYYHDVGKLIAPGYFSENQNGVNPHDFMEPRDSCRIIISHAKEGVALCEKNKLPARVISIVREHHGNTVMAYFYQKAVMTYSECNVNKDDYRYPGPRPSSRESALVMMADSCEAAVRSMEQKEEKQIVECVKRIIRSKIEDGQLESCMISMNDVYRIENTFVRVLMSFYHTRIKYPDESRLMPFQPAGLNGAETAAAPVAVPDAEPAVANVVASNGV
jgi:putative nucleotidyltransferase with HDIG domain